MTNIKLLIGDKNQTHRLISQSLSVTRTLADYSGQLQIKVLPHEQHKSILNITQDIKVYDGDVLLIAGIAETLDYTWHGNIMLIDVKIGSYKSLTNKRYVVDNLTYLSTIGNDMIIESKSAGALAWGIVKHHLASFGVTAGYVDRTVVLINDDKQIDKQFNYVSLREVLDKLAKIGNYNWTINMYKQFIYYKLNYPDTVTHIDDSKTVRVDGQWHDLTWTIDAVDYKNSLILIGGKNSTDTGRKIETTGNMYTTADNTTEIIELTAQNGGDGRWEYVVVDETITDRDKLNTMASKIHGAYAGMPYTLSFSCFSPLYNEGDFIFCELPMFTNKKEKMCVDTVEIRDLGVDDGIEYRYTCTRRDNNAPSVDLSGALLDKETDVEDAQSIVDGYIKKDQAEISMARNGLISHIDFTARDTLIIDVDNKILQALDVNGADNGLYAAQPVGTYAPTAAEGGAQFLRGQYMAYEQTITGYPMSVIVAYKKINGLSIIDGDAAASSQDFWTNNSTMVGNNKDKTTLAVNGIQMSVDTDDIKDAPIVVGITHDEYYTGTNSAPLEQIYGLATGKTWVGTVYEILIYDRQLSYSELIETTEYIARKHGIKTVQTTTTT